MGSRTDILQEINIFMESIDDLHRMLRQIMQVSMEAVAAQASSVFLYNPDKQELWFDVALGEKSDKLTENHVRLGEGIVGCAAQNLEIINIADVSRDERFDRSWDRLTGFTTRSILALPMIRRGELVGVLEVINKQGKEGFDREDQDLLNLIASQAAIAVENAKLFEVVLDKNRQLEDALAELQATQAKLIHAEKMSMIGNMSSQIMHDIRNPMSIIRMCCEILSTRGMKNDDIPEHVNIIKMYVDRSENMIRDFLDFARGETHLDLKAVPVAELIREIVDFQQRDCAEKGITLLTGIDYTGQVRIDRDKIHRALTNIINNAKEAITEKGNAPQGTISLEVTASNGAIEFKVADNGPGIPRQISAKLFEPFVTMGKKNGTGLGLAIVDKIVSDHGGTVVFESCFDDGRGRTKAGTTFVISLPFLRA